MKAVDKKVKKISNISTLKLHLTKLMGVDSIDIINSYYENCGQKGKKSAH